MDIRWLKYLNAYSLPKFDYGTYIGDFLPKDQQKEIPVSTFPDSDPTMHTANFKGFVIQDLEFLCKHLKHDQNASNIEKIALKKGANIVALPFGRFPGRKHLNGFYLFYKIKENAEESLAEAPRRT